MFVQKYFCGGFAPTPPAGMAIPAPCIRIQSNLLEFLPLFLQKESGFQGSALRS